MGATLISNDGEYVYFENRVLAQMPELTAENVVSGSYFTGVESYLKDHAAGRNTLLKINTELELLVNVKLLNCPVVNETVILDDVLLPFNDYETVSDENIAWKAGNMAQNLSDLTELVESYGGEYYYVLVPCQYVSYADEYPWYLNNRAEYTEKSRNALYSAIEGTNVNIIDMYDILTDDSIRDEVSSKTDNHYTIYGAYLTYLEIMNTINANRQEEIDVLTDGDFIITEGENHYVGSRTRKLFNLSNIDEKLGILTPNVPVEFTRYDNGNENESVVYSLPTNEYKWVEYSLYMGGDIAETVIDTDRDDLPSILVYGDSFTNAVESIIYYSFNEMHSLDLRHYSDMTLGEYIEQFKPDYVVCIRDYEQIISTDNNGAGVN
jgi:hypothetical protein